MRNKVSIILILIVLILASGCSETNTTQGLIKGSYFDDLEDMLFYKDINYKKLSANEDIDGIISILEKVEGGRLDPSNLKQTDFSDDSFRVEFNYDGEDKKIISFRGNKRLYEDNWYLVNIDIENLYNNIDISENVDNNRKIAQQKVAERKQLNNKDRLIGKWKYDNGLIIQFTKDSIIQFTQEETIKGEPGREFKYIINDYTDNDIYLTAYAKEGLFIKGKKLFDMYILLDENNINMKMKKVMVGSDMIYENNLIFIYEDDIELGNFDSFYINIIVVLCNFFI